MCEWLCVFLCSAVIKLVTYDQSVTLPSPKDSRVGGLALEDE